MAHGRHARLRRRVTVDRLARVPPLVAAAAVRVVALGAWLGLVRGNPPGSPATLLGVAGLAAGCFLAVLLATVAAGGGRERPPVARSLLLGVAEAALWVGWLAVAGLVDGPAGIVAAGALLALLLVPHRTALANLLDGEALLATLVEPTPARAAVVQAVGGAAWLGLAGSGATVLALAGVGSAARAELAGLAAAASGPSAALGAGAVVGFAVLAVLTLAADAVVVLRAWR